MQARIIKVNQEYFIESKLFDQVNLDKITQNNQQYNNVDGIEKKLTRFHIYPKTEFSCKQTTPFYKTQSSEKLVEYENSFDMKTEKLIINPTQTYKNYEDENSYIPVTFHF